MKHLLLALALSGSLYAAPITIFGTGVDASNVPLTGPDLQNGPNLLETHWTLISGPGPVNAFVTDWTIPYASEVPLNARWIGPAANLPNGTAPFILQDTGTYVLEQAFSLTGLLASTATLSGVFGADNCATITLNGNFLARTGGIGNCPTNGNPSSNFTALTNFSAGPGAFLSGPNNILRVELYNQGGPGGVLVDFTGASADIDTGVPEPATFVLIGSALVILTIRRKKA